MTEPLYDSILITTLDRLYRSEYGGADSALRAVPAEAPASLYFRGLIQFNRFDDLGDTAALSRAAHLWEAMLAGPAGGSKAPAPETGGGLYAGLARLQLSYVASLRGRSLRAASLGRRAAADLKPLRGMAEADAALALYDYYRASLLKGLAWLPFVEADVAEPLGRLESAVPRSRYLREVLQTSLLWLYYDRGRYDKGLALLDAFLARYPSNRTGRQIKADFLYRKRDYAGARALQEGLMAEYERLWASDSTRALLPIGYLSAVGNLAKVHHALNQADLRGKYLAIWSSPRFEPVLAWLPGSLRREVKDLGK